MTAILDIHGREILDSRGNPTVEVDVLLDDGMSYGEQLTYRLFLKMRVGASALMRCRFIWR